MTGRIKVTQGFVFRLFEYKKRLEARSVRLRKRLEKIPPLPLSKSVLGTNEQLSEITSISNDKHN